MDIALKNIKIVFGKAVLFSEICRRSHRRGFECAVNLSDSMHSYRRASLPRHSASAEQPIVVSVLYSGSTLWEGNRNTHSSFLARQSNSCN